MLCKGNHKAWARICSLKKQEIDRIAQALLLISHRTPQKLQLCVHPAQLWTKMFFMKPRWISRHLFHRNKRNQGRTKPSTGRPDFLVASNLPIPGRLSQKRTWSRSRSSHQSHTEQLEVTQKKPYIAQKCYKNADVHLFYTNQMDTIGPPAPKHS